MKKGVLFLSICLISIFVVGALFTGCAVEQTGAAETTAAAEEPAAKEGPFTLAWVPKGLGHPYFNSCYEGAKEAVAEWGDEIFEVGPDDWSVEGQIAVVESLIQQKPDVIGIAANDADALAPVCQRALEAGIHVIAWDAPVNPSARESFVNQASFEAMGRAMIASIGEMIDYEGEIAILSATPQAPNQRKWVNWMYEEMKDPKYANMTIVDVVFGDDQSEKSYNKALSLFQAYPNLKGIVAPTAVATPAAIQAVVDEGLVGKVYVSGMALPSSIIDGMKAGATEKIVMWNTIELGYVAGSMMHYIAQGDVTTDPETGLWISTADFSGKLGSSYPLSKETSGWPDKTPTVTVGEDGDNFVLLGPPLEFTMENIDEWASIF